MKKEANRTLQTTRYGSLVSDLNRWAKKNPLASQ